MIDQYDDQDADTLTVAEEPKSSARILSAIKKAGRDLYDYQALCDRIDDIYGRRVGYIETEWSDVDYDLFWASMEIMKPAIYARPPRPVVSPMFKDRRQLQNVTAELLERNVTSTFSMVGAGIDEAMICARDDLIFYNRGQLWLTYETDEDGGGQRVCTEHLDRKDFLTPQARKWSDLPWAARRAWLTRKEMRKRFKKISGDAYMGATACTGEGENKENEGKYGVWEVWHKGDKRVYWVAEGVPVMLDEGKPHLTLRGFFPCPRPAFGTLRPRTLVPVPDYVRYAGHFKKINSLTRRIYDLLDMIRMKGLIPAGGDIGDAIELALRDDSNSAMFVPVPGAALLAGGSTGFVTWIPISDIATAIQGLIEARRELFSDFDRLSGISDIMRGETEADETLGAQQLKSQYGSVRVREKVDELQRLARDVTQIAAEIMAEEFSKETLLDMSQMEIPTKAEIQKKVDEIEKDAKEELKELAGKARETAQQAMQGQQGQQQQDPQQMQQMAQQGQQQFQQAQQQIIAKYAPMLKEASEQVPIEDVMKLLRDDKARGFAFEIETDSTILSDEQAEKAQRNEFMTVFSGATQGLMSLAAMGPAAAKLAGEVMKFTLQPYRVGRSLNAVIDEFIDSAPKMAAAAASKDGNDEANQATAEANKQIAQAELMKAQAKVAEVQAKGEQSQADNQRKFIEVQQKGAIEADKHQRETEKLNQQLRDMAGRETLMQAQVDNLTANTAKILASIGLDERKQQLSEYSAAESTQAKKVDQAMNMQDQQHGAAMDERQQGHAEQQGERAESRADRQQDFSEQSTDRQMTLAERQAAKEPV